MRPELIEKRFPTPRIPRLRVSTAAVLPVAFILGFMSVIEAVYVALHLLPQLQLEASAPVFDLQAHRTGRFETVVSQALVFMMLVCYARAVLTSPGSIPASQEWFAGPSLRPDVGQEVEVLRSRQLSLRGALVAGHLGAVIEDAGGARPFRVEGCGETWFSESEVRTVQKASLSFCEFKATGQRRMCKWCRCLKPDRAHHCRICQACVLKMDHHCPWIMNCVGHKNYKFFFLLIFYSVLASLYVAVTAMPSFYRVTVTEVPQTHRFYLALCVTLASFAGILLSVFWTFHIWLMLRGMTTIEFCEKATSHASFGRGFASYDRGRWANLIAALGPHALLWLLPLAPPDDSGVDWASVGRPDEAASDPEWTSRKPSYHF